ncbi:hypothetical protein K7G98_33445, partial [Saccharothrix sp. MB29]|nr:hypothetical protein [Saccharothrix sp. MB29]
MERLHLVVRGQRDLGQLDLGRSVQFREPGGPRSLDLVEGTLQLCQVLAVGDHLIVERADLLPESGDLDLDGGVGR